MKNYINMAELIEEIKKRSVNRIYSENKIREKILELFKVMNIRTEYLQVGRKPTGEYRFPVESVGFLCELYDFYTTPDGKSFRRGEFEKIDLDVIRNIIGRMMDMLEKCDMTQEEISEQEIIILNTMNFIYLDSRDKIRQQLESLILDFFPKTREIFGGFSRDPDHPIIRKKSRFRYALRDLDAIDMYFFFEFVLKDLKRTQMKYRRIYENMVEIRRDEVSEEAYRVDSLFDDEDVNNLRDEADKTTELMIMLYNNPEYNALAIRHYELTHSSLFIKKRDKELLEIESRMSQIEKEYVGEFFNGQISNVIDPRFESELPEEDPEVVLKEAIKKYREEMAVIDNTQL
ncbi:MAG: hypothetical protein HFI82_09635 [Eubacterium sp.]|jgi:hypothetical protein|nr:hypothetical protein [Eubacterium sp.]